jgi:protein-tyrosine phosphatase
MGAFGGFFKKKQDALPDFSIIGTDIHSHILPGLDDGCQTMEESLAVLKKLEELKYTKVITTPHVNYYYPLNTPEHIEKGLKNLQKAANEAGINMEVEAAAEYMIDDEFADKFQSGKLLTFGKKYLLIEFSYHFAPSNLAHLIFNLQIEGYKVIIAHPERYTYWHKAFNVYDDLKTRGVFFQVNMMSLTGIYSPQIRRIAEKLIDADMIESLEEPFFIKLVSNERLLNKSL